MPYGHGGGGSFSFHGVAGPQVIAIASLAKGFGAPLAVLTGSRAFVHAYEAGSETRHHNSPPSLANIAAGARALALNRSCGEMLRGRLLGNIRRFRARLAEFGLRPSGDLFPTQTLYLARDCDTGPILRAGADAGINALVITDRRSGRPALAFIITAMHEPREIDRAARVAGRLVRPSDKARRMNMLLRSRPSLRATCSMIDGPDAVQMGMAPAPF
jgi:8-amino-7-oxononanoate synthase